LALPATLDGQKFGTSLFPNVGSSFMSDNENAPMAPQLETSQNPLRPSGSKEHPTLLFDGPRRPLFWLLLRNFLLTIITAGIYRFWAKTKVRKFFWQRTKLLNEPLEYLGTGGELFVGFLIAIVILVPFGATYSLLQFLMVGMDGALPIIIQVAYYTIIGFLIHVAIYRMRRYRLTRTAWRGVRFGLDGSAFRYAVISFLYTALSIVTLSLANPWLRVATMKYFVRNARFGGTSLSLSARAMWLFPRWLAVGIPNALALGIFVILNWQVFARIIALNDKAAQGVQVGTEMSVLMAQIVWWPFAFIAASFLVGIWYSVVEFRYLIGSLTLGKVALKSSLTAAFVYRVYIVFWVAFFAVLALIGSAIMITEVRFEAAGTSVGLQITLMISAVAAYFLYGAARTLFVDVTLLKRACATLEIENTDELDNVIQSSADLPGHGEGLADALDVGGF
jgi:uncharacterized membrane protein YjgN (DUF898 family)